MDLLQEKASVSSVSSSIATGGSWRNNVWNNLVTAWTCFDRVVGNFIGLDESRFAWAVLEHQRLQKEQVGV